MASEISTEPLLSDYDPSRPGVETSEFKVFALVALILVAMAGFGYGGADVLATLGVAEAIAYTVSRGLAKRGAK